MNEFALFITWTCYGTWLPGDKRGYVSNTRQSNGGFQPRRNKPGTPYTTNDAETQSLAKSIQKRATVRLTQHLADHAARAFIEVAVERNWMILRGAVMANHVHLVVHECPDDGPAVRRIFKGVSQAKLNEAHGSPNRWWTRGGSDRYLHGTTSIEAAVQYVAEQEYILCAIERNILLTHAS